MERGIVQDQRPHKQARRKCPLMWVFPISPEGPWHLHGEKENGTEDKASTHWHYQTDALCSECSLESRE